MISGDRISKGAELAMTTLMLAGYTATEGLAIIALLQIVMTNKSLKHKEKFKAFLEQIEKEVPADV